MHNFNRYKILIEKLLKAGLRPTTNWNKKLDANTLLLRHDIDFSIDYAYQIALVEHNLNVNSTFFFMLSTNMYNFLSDHNQRLVKKILEMGHKISLHFDIKDYKNLDSFSFEKKIFENITNVKIDIVSIHRPGSFLNNNNSLLKGIPQTYQDIYYKNMLYISDSGGKNIFPAVIKYINKTRERGLHLLTHPVWWIDELDKPTIKLNLWRSKYFDFITSQIRDNCKTYEN